MEGGGFFRSVDNNINDKITLSVIITCIVAGTSGLLFGYDLGVSGLFLIINPFCLNLLKLLIIQ